MNNHTHGSLMGMRVVCSVVKVHYEKVHYEKVLACLLPRLLSDRFSATAADLDFWCGGNHASNERFTLNHANWAHNTDTAI